MVSFDSIRHSHPFIILDANPGRVLKIPFRRDGLKGAVALT